MKKKLLFAASLMLLGTTTFSQQGDGGTPLFNTSETALNDIDSRVFETPDIDELRIEDAIVDADKSGPWRFGYNNDTDLNFSNSGTWLDLANGGKLWQVVLNCDNALTVNLTFENLTIPAGNEMYVFNPSKSFILGKFTRNHIYEGQLGTELVPGSTAIVEYYVAPENVNAAKSLTISKVTHGYRTAGEFQEKAFGSSGNCNMNSICPDGDPIRNPIRATMMLVSGSNGFCTGSMINNTANDGRPYVLTANHCTGSNNFAQWIFRFNWASANCSNPGSSPSFVSMSGSTLRSRRTASDFCLVEITGDLENGTVPEAYNTYFPGWDNSGSTPSVTTCVHHPSGDIKKIAFDDNAATSGNGMGSTENNSQWVVSWDRNTTTEPGSSGSPLFDQNNRIIGQLWGGGASCSNLSAPDYYGKVSSSWDPNGSNSSNHLQTWLDPSDTETTLDGFDPITYCNSTFTSSQTNEMCFGDDNGSIDVSFLTGVSAGATFDIGNGAQTSGLFENLAQGSYTVVVIDGEACATNVSVTLGGPGNLTTGAGTGAEITPNSGSINLTVVGGTPGFTFSWTGPDGFTADTEDLSGIAGGVYSVFVTDANGCTTSRDVTVNSFVDSSNNLEELTSDAIKVFPNPSNGVFNVTLNGSFEGAFAATVMDLSGRVIYTRSIENKNMFALDLSDASNGTYIVQLASDKVLVTKRIVIKK